MSNKRKYEKMSRAQRIEMAYYAGQKNAEDIGPLVDAYEAAQLEIKTLRHRLEKANANLEAEVAEKVKAMASNRALRELLESREGSGDVCITFAEPDNDDLIHDRDCGAKGSDEK